MKQSFTRTQLLLYAYNELDLLRSDASQRMIDGDPLVASDYREMTKCIEELDEFKAEPSEESILKILAFAAK